MLAYMLWSILEAFHAKATHLKALTMHQPMPKVQRCS